MASSSGSRSRAAVGTIRLDRPPMNALNVPGAGGAARRPPPRRPSAADVRAVVVYGGEKVFAAGADIKEMARLSYAEMVDALGRAAVLASRRSRRIPKPTVAAVTGYALGGGCELALCGDLRVGGDNAKLGQPEILLGDHPRRRRHPAAAAAGRAGQGQGHHLHRPVRRRRGGAARSGWSTGWCRADDVYAAARALAAQFVGGPAFALRAAKEAIDRGLEVDLDTGLEIERLQFAGLFATEDRTIGMDSFVENGPGRRSSWGADV